MANKNDNLKKRVPFKKGDPRINRAGRSPKLPELDKLLADVLGEDKEGVTAAEAILKALRAKAAKGDIRAAEVLLDRAYGKAKQAIDMTTNGESINKEPDLTHLSFEQLKELQRGAKGGK